MSFFPTVSPGWTDGLALVHQFEIILFPSDLKPSDLKAIRNAGGEYTAVRGLESKRYVSLPPTAVAVFDRLMARAAASSVMMKGRVIICRGAIERFGGLHVIVGPTVTVDALLKGVVKIAHARGKACTCCGWLIPKSSHLSRCAECHAERDTYERAKHAAEAAGKRYELAERLLWAANQGVMAIFEELGREPSAPPLVWVRT